MTLKYLIGKIQFIFEDDYRAIIHQNEFDLPDSASFGGYSIGTRVQLDDDGTTYIGTISDIRRDIAADSSNNYVDSLQIHCSHSYKT